MNPKAKDTPHFNPSAITVVATPIGNLEDISQRALKALAECDAILCEDTRRSDILLKHYGIQKPLYSYHKFKEQKAIQDILNAIASGKRFALISDAGTPCICDPGARLLAECSEKGIPFTVIPGPCSIIQALVMSTSLAEQFQFVGFLEKKPEKQLRQILCYPGATVAFESPQRLTSTLNLIQKLDPNRKLSVAREMTKTFEECRRGNVGDLLAHFQKSPPKGEIVLVIEEGVFPLEQLDLESCVQMLRELHGLSLKEAIKSASRLLKIPKGMVYKQFHKN